MTDPTYVDLISRYVDEPNARARQQTRRVEDLQTVVKRARAERSAFLSNLFRRHKQA
ncbi:hypothetical protein H0Z60_14160 [Ectothiorhodospiraceae bacterium WFHF3C12]|nr:hypothetical protein [Ectothiorhodospiraceae bacterium WFHF3C12]